MSADIIIFDFQYTDMQIKNLESAGICLDEAMQVLRQAASHRGWRCPEVRNITEKLDETKSGLKRINRGVTASSQVLRRSQERFHELETRSQRQSSKLSENLRDKYGFTASVHGKDENTTLPVTEVPNKEDSWIVKTIKGTVKNAILGVGAALGVAIGGLVNGIVKTAEGFVTDVKDAIITPMVDIFQASYAATEAIKKGNLGDVPGELWNIFTSSVSLLSLAAGASKGNVDAATNVLEKAAAKAVENADALDIIDTASTVADMGYSAGETIKNPELLNNTLKDYHSTLTDAIAPFGLDQTIIQGVKGILEGQDTGAEIGIKIANELCNHLGL